MRRPWIFSTSMGQGEQAQRKGHEKLGGDDFWGSYYCVSFLGKGRRRMKSFSRWWKGGKWVGCFGYFKE
jgi:hypothetical protein